MFQTAGRGIIGLARYYLLRPTCRARSARVTAVAARRSSATRDAAYTGELEARTQLIQASAKSELSTVRQAR